MKGFEHVLIEVWSCLVLGHRNIRSSDGLLTDKIF